MFPLPQTLHLGIGATIFNVYAQILMHIPGWNLESAAYHFLNSQPWGMYWQRGMGIQIPYDASRILEDNHL